MSEAINLVEVYVPGQNCRKILAPMPRPIVDPVLAYIAGWIKTREGFSMKMSLLMLIQWDQSDNGINLAVLASPIS